MSVRHAKDAALTPFAHMYSYHGFMAVKRLPRGTRVDPVRTPWAIERTAKERFDSIARNAGMSSGALLEHVIAHLETELSDQGVPSWMPQPERVEGELPIDAA